MPIATGTHIGPYEVVGWLGAGGMGVVYRARDTRLGRDVALKVISDVFATDASRVRRFEQEARAAGQLNHPNILAVYDVGSHEGAPYIVSELLEGQSLSARLQGGALAWRKAIDYARQMAEGLSAAHDKGIIHRDVKPDNLFLTPDERVKILDFGIVKLTRPGEGAIRPTGLPTETGDGMVIGTAGYMSPEQVRGEDVDGRSDIFSLGTILYEMLTGRPAFVRETAAETMTAILKHDPAEPVPPATPPALERIVSRCLEKTREARFQSARDLAFALEYLSGTVPSSGTAPAGSTPRHRRAALGAGIVVLCAVVVGVGTWLTRATTPSRVENLLTNAQFSRVTDWDGTETNAEISPDGRFVAFLADRAGEFDLWLSQVGTGRFVNLTDDLPPLDAPAVLLRSFGFSGDGSELWFSPPEARGQKPSAGPPKTEAKLLMPLIGGARRAFLGEGAESPSWSPDGNRLVFFTNGGGDPIAIADKTGADARAVVAEGHEHQGFFAKGAHNHNPVWSPDGQWIYFVHGTNPTVAMDIWRIRPSGGSPERLTQQEAPVNLLAPLDSRTLLYVAPAEDRSGPWLWALDIATKATRRVNSGLERYTSVAASRDGRRVVATVANPTASLWRVPLLDRPAEDLDAEPYPLPTTRALAPRFGGTSLYYLSSTGAADGLWRVQDGQATEVFSGTDSALSEPAAVSRDGRRVAVAIWREGKRQLAITSADGTNARTLSTSFDIQGAAGQGIADWSPDATWLVMGGADAQGPGLFKVPAEGGASVRLVTGPAFNPVWSPDGNLIVYGGALVAGQVQLLGVRPDGTPVEMPDVRLIQGSYRFLPQRNDVVFRTLRDFWLLDLSTNTTRQITRLGGQSRLHAFDMTPDGKYLVFDRARQNSDIVLIDFPQP